MTTTTLKHVAVLLVGLIIAEVFVFGNLIFAKHDIAAAAIAGKREMISTNIPDIASPSVAEAVEVPQAAITPAVDITTTSEEVESAIPMETYYDPTSEESEVYSDQTYDPDSFYFDPDKGFHIPAGTTIAATDFIRNGKYFDDNNTTYTYYPESVLPGGGLEIPGRHTDEDGYICDADGYICIASDDLPKGTIVEIPFGSGTGVVYDTGSGSGNLDIYTSW